MENDPYIGKIVKCLALTFDEDSSTYFNQGEFFRYKTDSLFYVLGIKQKEYSNIKDFFYIFKPLNNDKYFEIVE